MYVTSRSPAGRQMAGNLADGIIGASTSIFGEQRVPVLSFQALRHHISGRVMAASLVMVLLAMVLGGCQSGSLEAAAGPNNAAPAEQATSPVPPTDTPEPSATPTDPPTPTPTVTVEPTAEPTETPFDPLSLATPVPTRAVSLNPGSYPAPSGESSMEIPPPAQPIVSPPGEIGRAHV